MIAWNIVNFLIRSFSIILSPVAKHRPEGEAAINANIMFACGCRKEDGKLCLMAKALCGGKGRRHPLGFPSIEEVELVEAKPSVCVGLTRTGGTTAFVLVPLPRPPVESGDRIHFWLDSTSCARWNCVWQFVQSAEKFTDDISVPCMNRISSCSGVARGRRGATVPHWTSECLSENFNACRKIGWSKTANWSRTTYTVIVFYK